MNAPERLKSMCRLIVAGTMMMSVTASAQDLVWEHDIKARTMHGWWVSGSGLPVVITGPFVSEADRIEALDPSTGESLWQRSLIEDRMRTTWEPIPGSDRAIKTSNAVLLDLTTGKDMWQPTDAGITRVYDYLQIPELGLVLVHGPSRKGPNSFTAVETATGKVRWQRGDVLIQPPIYECPDEDEGLCPRNFRGELKRNPDFSGLQPALAYEDSIILFLNYEGPVRVSAQTGDVVWRSELAGSPRRAKTRNAPMQIEGDRLFVSQHTKVAAVDLKTGSVLWPTPKETNNRKGNFKFGGWKSSGGPLTGGAPKEDGPVSVVETTPSSVLVYGYSTKGGSIKDKFFDLLDAETGASRWGNRFIEMKDWGRLDGAMVGDTTYIVSGNKRKLTLYEISPTGGVRETGNFDIKGSLNMVELYDRNLLITTEEEMIMVRPKDASVVYKGEYPAPEVRMAEVLAAGLVTTLATAGASQANEAVYKKQISQGDARAAAEAARNQQAMRDNLDKRLASQDTEVLDAITRLGDYVYFYLSKNAGGGARTLVEVSKKDGKITRRVPLEGVAREINYELDLPNNRVIVQHKGGVQARKLPPPDSGNPAASESASDIGSGGDDSVAGGDQPAAAVADPEQIAE